MRQHTTVYDSMPRRFTTTHDILPQSLCRRTDGATTWSADTASKTIQTPGTRRQRQHKFHTFWKHLTANIRGSVFRHIGSAFVYQHDILVYTAIHNWRCGGGMLFVDVYPSLPRHQASRALPFIALYFHELTHCTYCLDVKYADWNISALTSLLRVMQKDISGSGFNGMKTAVARYAKMLRRCIASTTPLE